MNVHQKKHAATNIISCKSCSESISDAAEFCPYCGKPALAKSGNTQNIVRISIALVALIALAVLFQTGIVSDLFSGN